MSDWAYVIGIVRARVPSRTDAETMYIAQTVVNHLPKISGSEGSAKIHVHLEDGHSGSSNVDEFDQFSDLYDEEEGLFRRQNMVLITISGRLRDVEFEDATGGVNKFLCRLAKRLEVDDCSVRVKSCGRDYVFTNKNAWLEKMYPDYDDEQWTDYLRWEPKIGSDGHYTSGKPSIK